MFVLANRNIILPTREGDASMLVRAGSLVDIPTQFCDTPYFHALVKDGKISVPAAKSDKAVVSAAEESAETLKETVKRTRKSKD